MSIAVTAPLRVRRFGEWDSPTLVSRIEGRSATELYVRVRPRVQGVFLAVVQDVYAQLQGVLADHGATRRDVITERLFVSDLTNQHESLRRHRQRFYSEACLTLAGPAVTYLQQPPCRPGVPCELQARVIFASGADPVEVADLQGDLGKGSGRAVSCAGYDHVYLHGVTGCEAGDDSSFAPQAESVFARAAAKLEQQGLTFGDVIRTWIYVDDIDRDYAELNRVRDAFFRKKGLRRLPASTGIQGGVFPGDRGIAMDVYALRADRDIGVEVMRAPTLNEAPSYGASFSRGLAVTREDRTVVYVSGTASIDDAGRVVHAGDIEGQTKRMLLNVESLLAGIGAGKADLVRATTYLKDAAHHGTFSRIWKQEGFPLDIPHTICRADVCRPEWLCETEAVAVLGRPTASAGYLP